MNSVSSGPSFGKHVIALILTAVLVAANPPPAFADESHGFDIAATDASSVVREFGRQSGVQVMVSGDLLRERKLNAVTGHYSTDRALQIMLADSGLTHRYVGERGVVLLPADTETTNLSSGSAQATPRSASVAARLNGQSESMSEARSSSDSPAYSEREPVVEVVVTGSRISKAEYQTTAPMTVVGEAAIAQSGFGNIADVLLRTPVFSEGVGSSSSNWNADAGATLVNLRGLGTERTLVLVNGRRRVAGTASSSAVDLSMITANMIGMPSPRRLLSTSSTIPCGSWRPTRRLPEFS